MQENKLSIRVDVPVSELFAYTVSPWNAHMWIDEVKAEECSPWPPQVGVSHYRSKGAGGLWSQYVVSAFETDTLFELTKPDGRFVVRYSYEDLGNGVSELTYHERVSEGEIDRPLSIYSLEKLKRILEDKPL